MSRISRRPRLNDAFQDWLTDGGIFSAFTQQQVPWDISNALNLGIAYHGSRSGDKISSPLVNRIMTGDSLTAAEQTKLASVAANIFGVNWAKLWALQEAEYNPLQNYNMTETEIPAAYTETTAPAETTSTVRPAEVTDTETPPETTTTTTPQTIRVVSDIGSPAEFAPLPQI